MRVESKDDRLFERSLLCPSVRPASPRRTAIKQSRVRNTLRAYMRVSPRRRLRE
jgi:hypothetical protein